jgi:integrase
MGGRCVSEVLHLRWEDIDFAKNAILIRSGREQHRLKSGKSRKVPMTPRLAKALREHSLRCKAALYHGKQTPFVFHHERDRRGCTAGDRVTTMRSAFDTAQAKAGITAEFHRHDLRHRRVTTWLKVPGANPVKVMRAMGHADIRTTLGYEHLEADDLQDLVTPIATPTPAAEKQA